MKTFLTKATLIVKEAFKDTAKINVAGNKQPIPYVRLGRRGNFSGIIQLILIPLLDDKGKYFFFSLLQNYDFVYPTHGSYASNNCHSIHSSSHKIHRLVYDTNSHHNIQGSPPLIPIMNQINPI